MLRHYSDDQRRCLAFIGACMKGIAHNMNTPLAAVMGRAEMLQLRLGKIKAAGSSTLPIEDLDRCLNDVKLILENSAKVSAIIKNAMKKTMSAETHERQPLRIDQLLHEELDFLMADMFFKHNVTKQIDIQEPLPVLEGVAHHFSHSFLEIIDNSLSALQETPEKKLTVRAYADAQTIRVEIHDTGCGIDPELQQTLRAQFHAPQPTASPDERGLQRVARLLAPYRARFELSSTPGNTTMTIVLPLTIVSG